MSMTFGEAKRRLEEMGCTDVKLIPLDMDTDNPALAIVCNDSEGIKRGLKARGGDEIERIFMSLAWSIACAGDAKAVEA